MSKTLKKQMIVVFVVMFALFFAVGLSPLFAERVSADGSMVRLVDGGYIRVGEDMDSSGLKFEARIDKTEYDSLKSQYANNVSAGMIIVPTDYVVSAGGFTFSQLNTLGKEIGYREYSSFRNELAEDGTTEEYGYSLSIVQILDVNFTRVFAARAYVKIVSDSAISGSDEYVDGASYFYSAYNETKNARTVYEIAYASYADGNTDKTVKNFIDGVVIVESENGSLKIANNSANYTSPYSISFVDGVWQVNGAPKSMVFDGVAKKDFKTGGEGAYKYIVPETTSASTSFVHKGASFNSDGTVTLSAGNNGNGTTGIVAGSGTVGWLGRYDNNYIAWNDDYKVGTFVEFEFTGNNMPTVCFFADKINGNMSGYNYDGTTYVANNEKGFILSPGFYDNGNSTNGGSRNFNVFGLKKAYNTSYSQAIQYSTPSAGTLLKWFNGTTTEGGEFNMFAMGGTYVTSTYYGLSNEFASTNLRYVVGTYVGSDSRLSILAEMYNADTNVKLGTINWTLNISAYDGSNLLSGKIIAYAAVKGVGQKTQFSYKAPTVRQVNGATYTASNAVKLAGVDLVAAEIAYNGPANRVGKFRNTYIAWEGDYGVGTAVEFYFKGNNMPQVCLFANNINGNMAGFDFPSTLTTNDNTGILLTNGFYFGGEQANILNGGSHKFAVWGPHRITNSEGAYTYLTGALYKYSSTYDDNTNPLSVFTQGFTYTGNATSTDYNKTMYGLSNTYADTNLKYVVSSYEGSNGNLFVKASMYNMDNNGALIAEINVDCKLEASSDILGGNLIAYATAKGAGNFTEFSFVNPYKVS